MVVRAHVILWRSGRITLTRRAPGLPAGGRWQLPGGHVEEGESVAAAARREAREEVGVEVDDARLVHVHNHRIATGVTRLALIFEATAWRGEPHNAEPEFCDAIGFYDPVDLPQPMVPYIADSLAGCRRGEFFSSAGWPA
jgi:8-oxo-dGTP diphosphatase